MRLTAKRKLTVITLFKAGAGIDEIAAALEHTPERIEGAIRDWMVAWDKLQKQEATSGS